MKAFRHTSVGLKEFSNCWSANVLLDASLLIVTVQSMSEKNGEENGRCRCNLLEKWENVLRRSSVYQPVKGY